MTRKTLLLAALLLPGLALAQPPSGSQPQGPKQSAAERFRQADKDGNGMLSSEEAKAFPNLEKHFDKIDSNQDGQISKDEMRAFKKARKQARKHRGEERFSKADTDHDGSLTRDEAEKGGLKRIAQNFDAIDANKDGKVSKDELRTYYRARMEERRQGKPGTGGRR